MNMSTIRNRFFVLLFVSVIFVINGKNAVAGEFSPETIFTFEGFTPEFMAKMLQPLGVEYYTNRFGDKGVSGKTESGRVLSIVRDLLLKHIRISTSFSIKEEFGLNERNAIFIDISNRCAHYGNLNLGNSGTMNYNLLIPMKNSNISLGRFFEYLSLCIDEIERIYRIGKKEDVLE